MKAIFKSVMALMAICAFTACSDVPMPYSDPSEENGGEENAGVYLDESFESNFGKFSVSNVKGTPWVIDYKTAKATGYDNTAQKTTESESYLVSAPIDLTSSNGAHLQFEYILRYVNASQNANKVLITDNYTGDPTTTAWTDMTGTLTEGTDWLTFVTYDRNLPEAFIGKNKVVIALMYSCKTSSSTIEVKNLKLLEGTAQNAGGDTPKPNTDLNTEATAWTVAEALQKISENGGEALSGEAYVKGVISSIDFYNETYKSLSYYISDDGSANNTLQIYSGKGIDGADFNSKNDLKVGQKVVVKGILKAFNGKNEMDKNNRLISVSGGGETPAVTGLTAAFATGNDGFSVKNVSLSEGLTEVWKFDTANKCMKANGYANKKNNPAQSMLVSPAFSLEGLTTATLTFKQAAKHMKNAADELQVLASTDGTNWTKLNMSAMPDGSNWNLISTTCDLSAFAGKATVYIAFQYTSTTEAAPEWRVNNVVVK